MTTVTDILSTRYPLIQAPMSWITDATLVAAVGEAGGLGVLGPNAGQTTVTPDPVETADRMRAQIAMVRQLSDKPFGLNIILDGAEADKNNPFLSSMLDMAYAEQVKYFVTVGEANPAVFNAIKEHGGIVIHRPLTPTVVAAREAQEYG